MTAEPASTLRPGGRTLADLAAHADEAAQLLRALSNRNRLMVLCLLAEGERAVGELLRQVPLTQSALSQHLAVLRRDGLVATRRASQTIYYSIRNDKASRLMRLLYELYCRKD